MALTKVTYSMIDGATVNALDYGAVGDGVTDDVAAIQAAVDALGAAGGAIFLPNGNYLITESIIFNNSNITFYGVGAASKIIVSASWSSPSSNAVFFADLRQNIVIKDLQCDLDNTAIAVEFTGTTDSKVDSCIFNDSPTFISVNIIIKDTCADIVVTNCVFVRSLNYSVAVNDSKRIVVSNCTSHEGEGRVGFNSGAEECTAIGNTFIMEIDRTPGNGVPGFSLVDCVNCTVVGNTITNTASKGGTGSEGVGVDSTSPNTISGNTITGFGIGIDISNNSELTTVSGNVITDCNYGVGSDNGGLRCSIVGNSIKSCDIGIGKNLGYASIQSNLIQECRVGIHLDDNARFCVIDSNQIIFIEEEGIIVNSTGTIQKHTITKNQLVGIGTSAVVEDTYYAIRADKLYDSWVCYNTTETLGGSLRLSGLITVTAGANNTIAFNRLLNTVPGPRIVGAAGDQIYKNVGYITEQSGTATIPSGSTSIAVSYSMNITPTAENVVITPTNSMGSATKFWLSSLSSAGLTISVDTDPGATTATFSYKVGTI